MQIKIKNKAPWYRTFLRIRCWRCPEAGIEYLEWAAGLKHDEDWIDKNAPSFGEPTRQALAAQETLTLYNWWKNERPKRLDPSEASGWSQYYEKNQKPGDDVLNIFNHTGRDERAKIVNIRYEIKKEQEDEDTAMLIRLIKIRQSLWT